MTANALKSILKKGSWVRKGEKKEKKGGERANFSPRAGGEKSCSLGLRLSQFTRRDGFLYEAGEPIKK